MTLPALDVTTAAGVDTLASEALQDIWAGHRRMAHNTTTPRRSSSGVRNAPPDTQNCAKASPSSREISFGD
jgi:hypothetical protein